MKRAMKLISIICVIAMALSCTAFALTPWQYDGVSYESLGIESEDADGEINLAVIANSDITLGNTMYIEGSIYTTGKIKTVDGDGNKIDGLFISDTGDHVYKAANAADDTTYTAVGYMIVDADGNEETTNAYNSKPTYGGAIYDPDTSFDCTYTPYTVPTITNTTATKSAYDNIYDENYNWLGWGLVDSDIDTSGTVTANTYSIVTVTQDTYFAELDIQGDAFVIDTTNGDVNVVIDKYNLTTSSNPYFTVLGENKANIYINSMYEGGEETNQIKIYTQNERGAIDACYDIWSLSTVENMKADLESVNGKSVNEKSNITFYLGKNSSFDEIDFNGSRSYANIVTDKSLDTGNASYCIGDFTVGGNFKISSSGLIWGTVCAPKSTSYIGQSAVLYGQLHTCSLDMSGAGAIIYQSDSVTTTTASLTVSEATATPEAEATATPEEEKAKIVRYTVATGEYARGTMDTKIHYPARGTNLDGEEEAEISYEVLDEETFTITGPQYISDKTKNEVQEILTTTNDVFVRLAADDSDLQTDARHTFNASRFGRIDSNGVDYSLSINPYVYPQIKDDITTMYLCWGDKTDNVEVIWYVIPQADLDAGL